ncbi:SDR family NAD(P)-dependent oxidoreductase [Tomitella fengzijianii]|uniref:SDR family NAD(P)-dependent oxidoreductase n=1 Tax=Tomitella fengzijianii TaxID=2597660 RepID=A0A516X208_9ACTN|nr:SDR family NAD(P)-dependent oxidoreductase [Tomitella fengzijianii]QDQ97050.1 SDR family NAD(P)-dependent oxidoreductase [Tomitella fengzijianii]
MTADAPGLPGGATATAQEAAAGVDCTGVTALVTGAGGGLGEQTSRALALAGARVIVTARRSGSAEAAAQRIRDAVPGAGVETLTLDLADLRSVAGAAATVSARSGGLDLLINNAGVMYAPLSRTADGFELQFGTNHLGHFLLTTMLLPALHGAAERSGTPSRVVTVSSDGHRGYPADLDDPNFHARDYDKFAAYGQSKSANALMTVELESRCGDAGVHGFAVHPGVCGTDLARHMDRADFARMRQLVADSGSSALDTLKSPAQGAATSVWAATAPSLDQYGGAYLSDCAIGQAAAHARDPQTAERLWELSERLVAAAR